jgi:hypothetical protein
MFATIGRQKIEGAIGPRHEDVQADTNKHRCVHRELPGRLNNFRALRALGGRLARATKWLHFFRSDAILQPGGCLT